MLDKPTVMVALAEVSTKGENRKQFVKILKKNLLVATSRFGMVTIRQTYDRLYIDTQDVDPQIVLDICSKTFGISWYALVVAVDVDFDRIVATASLLALKSSKSTFKVVSKRINKGLPYTSDQLNRAIAHQILIHSDKKVDLHHPDLVIKVEVKFTQTYISVDQYQGLGGLPVRMAGRGTLLLSGGFDSPVAGYLINKRGMEYIAVHFATTPFTSFDAIEKVKDLAQQLSIYQNKVQLYVVNFTPIQLKINEFIPESYRIIIMRRMMVRVANELSKIHGASCLISGESLGQVASQTISSITAIDQVSELVILRPTISYDKVEILALASKIGTYDLSNQPHLDCCQIFTPTSPTTNPLPHKVARFESFTDYSELIEQAVQSVKAYWITPTTITEK